MGNSRRLFGRFDLARLLDLAAILVLCISFLLVIWLATSIGLAIYHSDMMKTNVVRKSIVEKDGTGKVIKTTDTVESSNISNVKELFPLVASSLVFAGFASTVY